jgi:hypothetical protein
MGVLTPGGNIMHAVSVCPDIIAGVGLLAVRRVQRLGMRRGARHSGGAFWCLSAPGQFRSS